MNDGGTYGDLTRPPLRVAALNRALEPGGWRVRVLAQVDSTQTAVREDLRAGETHGLVVVAEEQTQGRGRLDRRWVSPPRAGLTFSVVLQPAFPVERWGWVPLFAGLAVAQALRQQAGVDAVLKWPNDVLVGGKKVCGILAEVADGARAATPKAVLLGIGLNVTTRRDELPHDQATSLLLEDATSTDRETLLRAVLRGLGEALADQNRTAYRALCATLGQQVRVELPGGTAVVGLAEAVDDDGRLVVGGTPYAAGDVVHLRS